MRSLKTVVTVLAATAVLWGCSDEKDCATCPPPETSEGLAIAGVALLSHDDLSFDCRVTGPGGATLDDVDSIVIEGRHVTLQPTYISVFPTLYGHLYYANSPFSAGDTIGAVVYISDSTAECEIALFGYPEDTVEFIGWSLYPDTDTVPAGTEIVVRWSSVPDADGYTYRAEYTYDSLGWRIRVLDGVLADTILTIPGEASSSEGLWRVRVAAYREANVGVCGEYFCGEAAVTGAVTSNTHPIQVNIAVDSEDAGSL